MKNTKSVTRAVSAANLTWLCFLCLIGDAQNISGAHLLQIILHRINAAIFVLLLLAAHEGSLIYMNSSSFMEMLYSCAQAAATDRQRLFVVLPLPNLWPESKRCRGDGGSHAFLKLHAGSNSGSGLLFLQEVTKAGCEAGECCCPPRSAAGSG